MREGGTIYSTERDAIDLPVLWLAMEPIRTEVQKIAGAFREGTFPKKIMTIPNAGRGADQIDDLVRGFTTGPEDWTGRLRLHGDHTAVELAHGIGRFSRFTEDRLRESDRYADALVIEQGEQIGRRDGDFGRIDIMYFFSQPLADRRGFALRPGIAFSRPYQSLEESITVWVVVPEKNLEHAVPKLYYLGATNISGQEFQKLWDKTLAVQQSLAKLI